LWLECGGYVFWILDFVGDGGFETALTEVFTTFSSAFRKKDTLIYICVFSFPTLSKASRIIYLLMTRLWVKRVAGNSAIFFLWRCDPTRLMASSFLRFLNHTQRRVIVGRTSLDEWSARRRDLYLTSHSTHNRQISIPPVGFEPTISAGERPQTYALDRAATETGNSVIRQCNYQPNRRKIQNSGLSAMRCKCTSGLMTYLLSFIRIPRALNDRWFSMWLITVEIWQEHIFLKVRLHCTKILSYNRNQ
jgi:hypothetical protein